MISSVTLTKLNKTKFSEEFMNQVKKAGPEDENWRNSFDILAMGKTLGDPKITLRDGVLWRDGLLWIPSSSTLRKQVLETEHDSKIAGHFGRDKTFEMVTRNFYWPKMRAEIEDYVTTCPVCQRNKSSRHRRYGLLQPLETPYAPWADLAMDFITKLPSSRGMTQIWVIVDRFTKMAHFIPLPTNADTKLLAEVFLREIWRLHGLPQSIVSDRDPKFTAAYWSELMSRLGVKSRLSTAFHPQTDGQSERLNQTLEAYLRIYCNFEQNDWVELLPLAEFSYNNSVTSATGISPFFANYGFHPRGNWPVEVEGKNTASKIYSHWLDTIHIQLKENLEETRNRMSKYYDRKKSEVHSFSVGSKVWLNGKHIKSKLASKKLGPKMYGPFEVLNKIGKNACRLKLPETWKCHNVFNAALLEPYRQSDAIKRPEEYEKITQAEAESYGDDQGIYEMEAIIGSSRNRRGKVTYLVKWKGYPLDEATWEPYENLVEAKESLLDFHKANPDAAKDTRVNRLVDET